MKYALLIIIVLFFQQTAQADVAPSPIRVKGIYTNTVCKIKMVSEKVDVYLYKDSSIVICSFNLQNLSDSISLEIGFPVMNFFHWTMTEYSNIDKDKFKIFVNDRVYNRDQIKVPKPMEALYAQYMYVYEIEKKLSRKSDSINILYGVKEKRNSTIYPSTSNAKAAIEAHERLYEWRDSLPHFGSELWGKFDFLMKEGNYPWYIWDVHFASLERKTIKVVYNLPCGMGYGDKYRYFNYLLETGSGWYDDIDTAKISIKIMDFSLSKIDSISPIGSIKDKKEKTFTWTLLDLEPSKKDNIYLEYSFCRSKFNYWYHKKFKYYANPIAWIRRAKYKKNAS